MERGGELGWQGHLKAWGPAGEHSPQNTKCQNWKSHSLDPPSEVEGKG